MTTSALQIVSVGVSDMTAALHLFRDVMGFRVEHEGELEPWEVPGLDITLPRQRLVELSAGGYPTGRIRLLQTPADSPRVRDDHRGPDSTSAIGAKAMDFYITHGFDEAIPELEQAGCRPRSQPIRWQLGESESEEMVMSGPDGVPILYMIGHVHSPRIMRSFPEGMRYSEMATQSVIANDIARSVAFYTGVLEMELVSRVGVGGEHWSSLDKLVDVEGAGQMEALIVAGPGDESGKYLLLRFGNEDPQRLTGRMRPGHLGVCLFTHDTDDLDGRIEAAAAQGLRASQVQRRMEPDGDFRSVLVIGPNEELVQLRERA